MNNLYVGLLSGTSMDAIDVAAFDFSEDNPKVISSLSCPLTESYKQKYLDIINSQACSIQEIGELDHWTGKLFADAVMQFLDYSKLSNKQIRAIGSHGQTLWHAPDTKMPFTMQIGDPNIIAAVTGITTVADFRRADVAAGGQGAPLAPAFHQAVFYSPNEARCIVNIGGISNISVLSNNMVSGFDAGPGNCLMDNWVKQHFNIDYDKDGEIAQSGKVSSKLLSACLSDSYFSRPAPKSTGRELFNEQWLQQKIKSCGESSISNNDIVTTLAHLTANSISDAIKNSYSGDIKIYLCGGGSKNSYLSQILSKLTVTEVQTTRALGIDPEWIETGLFAWLAKQRLSGTKLNLRQITGSNKPVLLGGVYE